MKRILWIFLFCPLAFSQAVRVDIPLLTSGPYVPQGGTPLPQALWLSNATVQICAHPATLSSCSYVTTYTDGGAGTSCPPTQQLVALPGNTCSNSSGTLANIGFWYSGGTVDYIITSVYGTYGPYTVTGVNGGGAFVSAVTTLPQTMAGPLLWATSANQIATLNSLESFIPKVNCPPSSTIAACIALLPGNGGIVQLEIGTYVAGMSVANTLAHVDLEGAGKPDYASDLSHLIGGTIIQGPVSAFSDFWTMRNLGIDYGQNVATALFSGTCGTAFAMDNNGQVVGQAPFKFPVVEHVSTLACNATGAYHGFLVENVANGYFSDISTIGGTHGFVLKGIYSKVDGVFSEAHATDCLYVKSDNYAPSSNDVISNVVCNSVAQGDGLTGGIIIHGATTGISDIALTNATLARTNFGIQLTADNVLTNVNATNITADWGGSAGSPSVTGCIQSTGAAGMAQVNISRVTCNNYAYGTILIDPLNQSMINGLVANNALDGAIINGASLLISDVMLQTTTYSNPVFASSLAGSHVFLSDARALGAWTTLTSATGGSTITIMSFSDAANQVVGGPMAGAPAGSFIIRGGLAVPDVDLAVQNAAGLTNLLLVHENGTVEAPSGAINSLGYSVSGTAGVTVTKTAGSCVLTIIGGIITSVTGC